MTDYRILYKFASRERPAKFRLSLDNIVKLSASKNYHIQATLDNDDPSLAEYKLILMDYVLDINVSCIFGRSSGKINAINRDMDFICQSDSWDICVVMSDDMHFLVPGFDNSIREAFEKHFPDLDGCVHFHDGPYGEALMGLNIQGRKYFERFGYLYHPAYKSLFCDNEQKDVAVKLEKYVYMGNDNKIVEHLHPCHVAGLEHDDLLRRTESFYHEDERTYHARKKRNFDL